MHQLEQHLTFAVVCVITGLFIVRLVLRERVTLQSSLSFLVLLSLGAMMALFPTIIARVSHWIGFELPSNFFFAASIFALALLHLHSLVMNSRVAMRSIALTQELAILEERLERLDAAMRAAGEKAS
jgi:hypothetical protein